MGLGARELFAVVDDIDSLVVEAQHPLDLGAFGYGFGVGPGQVGVQRRGDADE